MKKIILSVAIIALIATGAVFATRAYFSDTATITGNTFTSGTLDLKIDSNLSPSGQTWSNGFVSPVSFDNLYPGIVKHFDIDIKNEGSIDGVATIDLNKTAGSDALAGVIKFKVYYKLETDSAWVDTGLNGTVDQYVKSYDLGALPTDKVANVRVEWSVPTSAGNEIQGKSIVINGVFGLNQIANQ